MVILKQIRNNCKINQRLSEWHEKLALDTDILFLIMYAIKIQQNEIEKYERSVSDSYSIDGNTQSGMMGILTEIYQLYNDTLRESMKK